jgi:hypothetical protein
LDTFSCDALFGSSRLDPLKKRREGASGHWPGGGIKEAPMVAPRGFRLRPAPLVGFSGTEESDSAALGYSGPNGSQATPGEIDFRSSVDTCGYGGKIEACQFYFT